MLLFAESEADEDDAASHENDDLEISSPKEAAKKRTLKASSENIVANVIEKKVEDMTQIRGRPASQRKVCIVCRRFFF